MGMAFSGLNRPIYNPNQTFGSGYDPMTGAMSLSGGLSPQFSMPSANAATSVQPVAPVAAQAPKPSTWSQNGKGWSTVGKIGDVLSALGGKGTPYADRQVQLQQQDLANQLKQGELQVAAWKARNGDQPDVIRSLIAAGIDPKSPQGQAIIANNYSHPIVVGNAESGYVPLGGQFSNTTQNAPAPPRVGEVQDGYRYIGGDPANQASWVKQ